MAKKKIVCLDLSAHSGLSLAVELKRDVVAINICLSELIFGFMFNFRYMSEKTVGLKLISQKH